MKRLLLIAFTTLSIHAIAQTNNYPTTGDVTIYNYSPSLILQRNTDIGGFIEGVQTKLQDGTDNWFFGALLTGQWIVSKGNHSNPKMTILDNGNVGIGTTNPAGKLDLVDSNQHLTFLLNQRLIGTWPAITDATTMTIQSSGSSAGNLAFATGNSEVMRITSSSNIGVGTTNPQSPLHIKASTGYGSIRISPSSDNAESSMGFFSDAAGTANNTAWIIGNSPWGNTGKFIIGNQAAGGPIITALQNGSVGIGITSPAYKLDVSGDTRISGSLLLGNWQLNNNSWPGTGGFTFVGNNDVIFGISSTVGQASLQIDGAFIQAEAGKTNTYAGASQFNNTVNFPGSGIWNTSGNLGIGTTIPDQKLTVKGKIHAEEVIVDLNVPVADYVFKPTYKLMPLPEVEQFVKTNSHLPEIPSAKEITKNGLSMGEMQNKFLQKLEELTLYAIEQNKKIVEQETDRKTLEAKLAKQENQYNVLLEKVETLTKQIEKR